MEVKDVLTDLIDVSEFNTRKDLADGQTDSNIEDLARSIDGVGLLSPITVIPQSDGRYALVAGQRRLMAVKHLGWPTVPAIIRDVTSGTDAIAISLVENVHRADMNPRDKAVAFKALLDKLGDLKAVAQETGFTVSTIRRYIQLLDLSSVLQERLAAGEVKNTEALATLAQRFRDPDEQERVWERISGYRQDVQLDIIRKAQPDLGNLQDLMDQAAEGALGYHIIRNCPYDCPTIPAPLKERVAALISEFRI